MDQKIEKIRALYFAQFAMREAAAGAQHLREIPNPDQHLFHCIYGGIVVVYARPFGENFGMSRIEARYQKFEDGKMAKLHEALLEARHTIYAHKDLLKEGDRLPIGVPKQEIRKIRIKIMEDGKSICEFSQPHLPAEYLHDIEVLASYQANRIGEAAIKMAAHLHAGKSYHPGTYVLGEDFP